MSQLGPHTLAEYVQVSEWVDPQFPVTWLYPADAALYWTLDLEHMVYPTTPLYFTVNAYTVAVGFRKAASAYSQLVVDKERRRINTYFYRAQVEFGASLEERVVRLEKSQAIISSIAGSLPEKWSNDWLPEIKQHLAFWENFDLAEASVQALLDHLDETLQRSARLWELHFLIEPPMQRALQEFQQLHSELFGYDGESNGYELLVGFENATMSMSRALWQFGRQVLLWPKVCSILSQHSASDALAILPQSTQGRAFLRDLAKFLIEHGQRPTRTDWGYPSWSEDPTIVLGYLQSYVRLPDRDLAAEQEFQAQMREQAVSRTLAKLDGYPRTVRREYERLLGNAQSANVLTEEHTYYIVTRGMHLVRRVMLEFGRRFLHAGVIETPTDIFYLTLDELRSTAMVVPAMDRHHIVEARRSEMDYWAAVTPPPVLGTKPLVGQTDQTGTMPQKIRGQLSLTVDEEYSVELYGRAASKGRARGPARIVASLEDAGKLERGDVLIIDSFAPSWAPLFLMATGIVTNVGGILSHAAILAREFGIPAVVGTGDATKVITDNQQVDIDGSSGVVRVLRVEAD